MKSLRPALVIILLLFLIGGAWFWWNSPRRSDMTSYVPADSLVYLEFNSLPDIARALEQSPTWKTLAPIVGTKPRSEHQFFSAAARAGVAPANAVIFERAQVALVLVGMNTIEDNDTLRVKPETALLIETHTSKWRIRAVAAEALQKLATFAYGQATCLERKEEADYIECSSSGGERKIVAAIDDSLIVIGNTDKAVKSCLEAKHGFRPTLKTDSELQRARLAQGNNQSLGFGYISSNNSAKLFSWAAPLLMGRLPENGQLEQLLSASASKILRGISWTTEATPRGIQDRFLFSLEPAVAAKLKPAFDTAPADNQFWRLVPDTFQSLTIYRSNDPRAAWAALDAAVALKLDAVSSVVFGSLLKSGLSVYGVSDPKALLGWLRSPVVTLKSTASDTGSVLLAKIVDEAGVRSTLNNETFKGGAGQILDNIETEPNEQKEFTAVINDGYLLVGKTDSVRTCLAALRGNRVMTVSNGALAVDPQTSSAIVTLTNDSARLNSFAVMMALANGITLSEESLAKLHSATQRDNFSSTETGLNGNAIERKTYSAFGIFSTLFSLIQPDKPGTSLR